MHNSIHVSAYTPSNTKPEILESIFVQREPLLSKTVKWCKESILYDKKNHVLFIGPRGSGKTHLITMIINRLKNDTKLKQKMCLVWLGEDDVVTSFMGLMILIIENLHKTNPKRFNKECLKEAKGQKPDIVADIIMHSINIQAKDCTILLVKENMSDVFLGLKDSGQKKLRAFLQEQNNMVILASSQQLFKAVTSRDQAFFGTFDLYHLEVLSIDEAKQLIINIATLHNNKSLIKFLSSSQGCYRIRALHHLAGGNHRLYIELAAFLTTESLDDFVSALLKLADNLTPYFQERVKSLPAQQGQIVQKLCELQGATPVKTIAEETFIGERSVAKQLGELAKSGYVISHRRGKQSFYEMAEPLMRLALEAKNNHGKPLTMVASLLRTWFSDTQLTQGEQDKNEQLSDYRAAALALDKKIILQINSKIVKQINVGIIEKNYEKIISASTELLESPITHGKPLQQRAEVLFNRSVTYFQKGETELGLKDLTILIALEDAPIELKANALLYRSVTYFQQGEAKLGLKDLTILIALEDVPIELKAKALLNRSVAYSQQGEAELELKDLLTLISLKKAPTEQKAKALFNRSLTYFQQGEAELVIKDLTTLIALKKASTELKAEALFNRSITYSQQDEAELGLKDLTTIIALEDAPIEPKARALLNRSAAYSQQGEAELALKDLTTLIALKTAPTEQKAKALFNRSVAYSQQGKAELELIDLTSLIVLEDAPIELKAKALLNRSATYFNQGNFTSSLTDTNTVIVMSNISVNLKANALFNAPEIHYKLHQLDEAQKTLHQAFQFSRQNEGTPEHNSNIIVNVVCQLGPSIWQQQVMQLLEIYKEYEALDSLNSSLIHSISLFIDDLSIRSSFDKWVSIWKETVDDTEEMQLSILVLLEASETIKQKNDKSLMNLPKEIRELILPIFRPLFEEQ